VQLHRGSSTAAPRYICAVAKPLEVSELAWLLARLETGIAATARQFRMITYGLLAFGAVMALLFVARGEWVVGLAVLGLFGAIVAVLLLGSRKTSARKMQAVLDAVREVPDRVLSIARREIRDSRRMFTHQYLDVRTADAKLTFRASDWPRIIDLLERRCPRATVQR
jgi:hypothetical protein